MNVQASQYSPSLNEDVAGIGTGPVPAGPYYRDDYFELERAAIFQRCWLQIGHVCELPEPGSFIVRPVEVAKTSILITRDRDGKIHAFHNVCTHRGTQLVAEESGSRPLFTCRYHAWTFGSDGKLRSAPDFERFYVEKSQCDLHSVAVDVCAGLIFINLDPSPEQGLREFLGPLAEQLETLPVARATVFTEYVYAIEANWKLTYDNFQENYHLRFIHPRSGAAAGGPENPFGYPLQYGFHGPHRTQRIWTNPNPKIVPTQGFAFGKAAAIAAADGFGAAPHNRDYFALFPNFFILGTPTQHFSHCVMPLSATRSRGVIRIYWIGQDDSATKRFAREYVMGTIFDVHSEDRAVIEAGQRGLSSGALEYIHFQSQEVLCRHLMYCVDQWVQSYRAARTAAESA
ncbi:MAG TPA: aromatic ring-hydroxylating dioxygenase subunit alpha [Steroidobacteraceae bacterium]|nr:aromatic ring-hydroxylating dioxygenase subunit alpha [Steroidobacteraceae bacterium]